MRKNAELRKILIVTLCIIALWEVAAIFNVSNEALLIGLHILLTSAQSHAK